MSISMHANSLGVFIRMLTNLQNVLAKAEAYAAERKFNPDVYVTSRLAPDMHPLAFQIQSATDRAKLFGARVSGQTAPSWPDDEKTFSELKARLAKGIEYLKSIPEDAIEGTEDKLIPLKVRGEDVQWKAIDYLLLNAMPNFYFHVTTAYDIIRHNGVPVGKRDFTGA